MSLPLPALLALAVGAASPARAQELPEALVPAFNAGVQAMKSGRLDEADAAFRNVLQQGGDFAFVHHNLALVLQQGGKHEQAIAECRTALTLDPAFAPSRIVLGSSLLALGRFGEAASALERAVKSAPKEPLARLQLARAYEGAQDWPRAVVQYRALKELVPREPEYAYALGRAYMHLSEWSLRQIRDKDPRSARLQQALGHNYRAQGKPDQAIRAFEQAAARDPSLPEIHLALAQIHMEHERWDDARREIDAELRLVPDSAGARALQDRLNVLDPRSP